MRTSTCVSALLTTFLVVILKIGTKSPIDVSKSVRLGLPLLLDCYPDNKKCDSIAHCNVTAPINVSCDADSVANMSEVSCEVLPDDEPTATSDNISFAEEEELNVDPANKRPPGVPSLRKTSGQPTLLVFAVLLDAIIVLFTIPDVDR